MQPFRYFQIVNLVDCLSSWYKFVMNNPSNINFANFISNHVHVSKDVRVLGYISKPKRVRGQKKVWKTVI